jgi:hypothetical protein
MKERSRKRTSRAISKVDDASKKEIDIKIADELARFIEYHPAKRVSQNLRKMLMEFLTYEGATEVGYLQDLLYDLQGMFEFLEAIQQLQESNRK